MFNIGGGELIVIMLIALIVLGPQRLPDAARQIGKAMSDLKRLSTGFQNEVRSAIDTADDPSRVAARRNILAKEATDGAAVEDPVGDQAAPPPGPRLSAQARLAAKEAGPSADKAAPKKPTTAKKASAQNGTPVKKAAKKATTTKRTTGTKSSPADTTRRTKD